MSVPIQHNWEGIQWDWPLQHNDGIVKVTNTAEKFEVGLEALYFTPNEIQVKVVGNALDIQLEHQERSDQFGTISRRVTRTYQLPSDVDTTSIKSFLTNRGTLQISAAKKK